MINELLKRPLNNGDLVLLNLSSTGSSYSKYGLICGESQIFTNSKVISYGGRDKVCYLIEKPSEDELSFKRLLTKDYNNELRRHVLLAVEKENLVNVPLEIGNVYADKSNHLYIYLGKCKLTVNNEYINEDLNSLVTSGTHCFLRCLYTPNKDYLQNEYSLDNFKYSCLTYKNINSLYFNYLIFSTEQPTRFVSFIKKVKVIGFPHKGVFQCKLSKTYSFLLERVE